METVQSNSAHGNHDHVHEHGKMPIVLYFIGLVLAVFALILNEEYELVQNILFLTATITAGYHVIVLEGISETIENTHPIHIF